MNVVDIQDWASDALRTIAVTQDVRGLSYNLVVRQFVPKDGDAVVRTWLGQDGQHKTYYTTPWAIANMEDAGRDLYQFVGENVEPFINHYIRKDDLLSTTYKMALHRSRSASVSTKFARSFSSYPPLILTILQNHLDFYLLIAVDPRRA